MTGGVPAPTQDRLVVLQSVRADASKVNPYVPLLFSALSGHVDVVPFSWRSALTGYYDVLHLHWPEGLYASPSPLKAALKKLLTVLLLLRLRVSGRPIVQTLHNVSPHFAQNAVDARLHKNLAALTKSYIALNRHTPVPPGRLSVTVPHGDYKNWLDRFDKHPSMPHRVLFFGILRRYKNVVELVRAVGELGASPVELHIVGYPAERRYRVEVESAVGTVRTPVRLGLHHVDDAELAGEVTSAQLVVLPYSEMHNSGALLFALSLERPVLVPRNPVTCDLANEVGEDWVLTYDPPLTADIMKWAIERTAPERRVEVSEPDLELRSWDKIGQETAKALRSAARES